jgi:hypothetical protein
VAGADPLAGAQGRSTNFSDFHISGLRFWRLEGQDPETKNPSIARSAGFDAPEGDAS